MEFPIIKAVRKDLHEAEGEIGRIRSIPWEMIDKHKKQVKVNHGQAIKKIAERGGLYVVEVVAILNDKTWSEQFPDFKIGVGISVEDYTMALHDLHVKLEEWNNNEPKP